MNKTHLFLHFLRTQENLANGSDNSCVQEQSQTIRYLLKLNFSVKQTESKLKDSEGNTFSSTLKH